MIGADDDAPPVQLDPDIIAELRDWARRNLGMCVGPRDMTLLVNEVLRTSALGVALQKIGRGRTDSGRALGGEEAREIARTALVAAGIDWPQRDASIAA